jgi:hypothetical protein
MGDKPMKKRKIWANLSTVVMMAAPAATQAGVPPAEPPLAIGTAAEQPTVRLAQHQGHGGAAVKATPGGEGDEGGEGGGTRLPAGLHLARGIEMIRGHLLVGGELIEAGRWADALPHFLHPEEEIYGSLRDDLKAFNLGPFQTALKSLSQTVKSKNKEAYARARATVEERLAAAESSVLAKEENKSYFVLEAALETLQPTNTRRLSRRAASPTWSNTRMHEASYSRWTGSSARWRMPSRPRTRTPPRPSAPASTT